MQFVIMWMLVLLCLVAYLPIIVILYHDLLIKLLLCSWNIIMPFIFIMCSITVICVCVIYGFQECLICFWYFHVSVHTDSQTIIICFFWDSNFTTITYIKSYLYWLYIMLDYVLYWCYLYTYIDVILIYFLWIGPLVALFHVSIIYFLIIEM
jgi:hypothetical protein